MPDWSYQPIFRPLLFRLPAAVARDMTLKGFGRLGKMPGGSFVIRTFGHMELSPVLESRIGGTRVQYPVGLSGELDVHGYAHRSFAQLGFGFIEIGPVTLQPVAGDSAVIRDVGRETLVYSDPFVNEGVEAIAERFISKKQAALPYMFRVRSSHGSTPDKAFVEIQAMVRKLSDFAAAFYIDVLDNCWSMEERMHVLDRIRQTARTETPGIAILICVPLDFPMVELRSLLDTKTLRDWDGYVVGDGVRTERGFDIGKDGKTAALEKVRLLSIRGNGHEAIICKAGIHEPQDALDAMRAGASQVQLHTGFVYSGPGLPKRVNEAVLYDKTASDSTETPPSFRNHWGWMCLLGIGMIIGGILAWIIADTTVLLPYDETFLGMTRSEIHRQLPRLLHFMSHDRITLAGTMISIGVLYYMLAKHGLRYRVHWAKTALLVSGIAGFSSFFLYLGYGYFDPLHALSAVILFPMFVISMRTPGNVTLIRPPNLRNDRNWLLAQWGQLLFVILGFAFAVAGATISIVGITHVFVREDLGFLQLTPDTIASFNNRLLPLIAHDRAGFGGALFCDAIAVLATALWGIRENDRWIWRMFLFSGIPGFAAAFSVHWSIGYVDFVHLLPAYAALVLYVLGLALLYPYLMGSGTKLPQKVKVSSEV